MLPVLALLGVAQANSIKIPFECKDGECGSCLIKVTHLDGERIKGMMLTDKEKNVLKSVGKLPKSEQERAEVKDLPPNYRLACQTIVTDEDLLVEFTGEPGGARSRDFSPGTSWPPAMRFPGCPAGLTARGNHSF